MKKLTFIILVFIFSNNLAQSQDFRENQNFSCIPDSLTNMADNSEGNRAFSVVKNSINGEVIPVGSLRVLLIFTVNNTTYVHFTL